MSNTAIKDLLRTFDRERERDTRIAAVRTFGPFIALVVLAGVTTSSGKFIGIAGLAVLAAAFGWLRFAMNIRKQTNAYQQANTALGAWLTKEISEEGYILDNGVTGSRFLSGRGLVVRDSDDNHSTLQVRRQNGGVTFELAPFTGWSVA